jgi:hypothetical protein
VSRIAPILAALAAAACAAGAGCADPAPPAIVAAVPDFGPLVGGTRIELVVDGFPAGVPFRAFVGGRAAPLALALDAAAVEIVIPPGERPGDAEILLVAGTASATASGVFHYSTPPTIDAVTPATVVATSTTTEVTVTGTGFFAEGAGEVVVLVDGVPVADVRVAGDTALAFTAPPGRALASAQVRVLDQRGTAVRERAYRYVPSDRPGLLLFNAFGPDFATYYDPAAGTTVPIPRVGPWTRFTAVVRDDRGEYWAFERSGRFGRLDLHTQDLLAPVWTGIVIPALVQVGGAYLGIDRWSLRFGTLDPATGAFSPLGTELAPCCGSFGIAANGPSVVFTARVAGVPSISTLDPITGAVGTAIPIIAWPGFQVEDLRYFADTLYAVSRDGTLAAIDPSTGIATSLASPGRFTAIEVFDPAELPGP